MIHLDTSFLIRALVAESPEDSLLSAWLARGEVLAVSAVGWTEFLCGPLQPAQVDIAHRVVPERVPFGGDEAKLAARLFNVAGRRRGSLVDCMVAATALRAGAALATSNPVDFRRFETAGLEILAP